jgi:hypothetical protein
MAATTMKSAAVKSSTPSEPAGESGYLQRD